MLSCKLHEAGSDLDSRSCSALFAEALVVEDLIHGGNADEYIDQSLHHRPAAQEHCDDIPAAAKEPAKTDEEPVEATDDEEDPGDHVCVFHMIEKRLASNSTVL